MQTGPLGRPLYGSTAVAEAIAGEGLAAKVTAVIAMAATVS